MRHLLLLTHDPAAPPETPTATDDVVDDWVEITRLLAEAGVLVAGDALHPPDTATTVRRRDGRPVLTDGPYAETTELLVGYYVIDVPDLDAALAWAARMPNVRWGSVEVRPLAVGPASAGSGGTGTGTSGTAG